jgi:hypothetical protein
MNTVADNTSASWQKPTLRLVLTNEFGDATDITKDLVDSTISSVFWAIRDTLAGCGYNPINIDEWFPQGLG